MPRGLPQGVLIGAAVVIGLGVGVASAQTPSFPIGATTAQTMTPEMRQSIQNYAGYWGKVLNSAVTPQSVSDARERVIEPLRRDLTPVVREEYAQDVLDAVKGTVAAPNLVLRMNGLIVASQLPTGAVSSMCLKGLTDPSPAVRYWAGKALADVSSRSTPGQPIFDNAQQKTILAALQKAMAPERSEVVLEQMYRALGGLSIPEAQAALMQVLSQRVSLHQQEITRGLRADMEGLRNLKTRLVVDDARGENISARLKSLAAIAAKYLQVVSSALANNKPPLPDDLKPVAVDTVGAAEDILKFALQKFDPDYPAPGALTDPAKQGQFSLLMVGMFDWVGTKNKPGALTSSKIGIPFADLQLGPAHAGAHKKHAAEVEAVRPAAP